MRLAGNFLFWHLLLLFGLWTDSYSLVRNIFQIPNVPWVAASRVISLCLHFSLKKAAAPVLWKQSYKRRAWRVLCKHRRLCWVWSCMRMWLRRCLPAGEGPAEQWPAFRMEFFHSEWSFGVPWLHSHLETIKMQFHILSHSWDLWGVNEINVHTVWSCHLQSLSSVLSTILYEKSFQLPSVCFPPGSINHTVDTYDFIVTCFLHDV